MTEIPEILDWKEVRSIGDLPTVDKVYWCRMHSGRVVKLSFRKGNWITWTLFHHPDTDPLAIVAAYAPYTPSRQTQEQVRELQKQRARERKAEREREHQEWIAAGRPLPRILKRKNFEPAKADMQ